MLYTNINIEYTKRQRADTHTKRRQARQPSIATAATPHTSPNAGGQSDWLWQAQCAHESEHRVGRLVAAAAATAGKRDPLRRAALLSFFPPNVVLPAYLYEFSAAAAAAASHTKPASRAHIAHMYTRACIAHTHMTCNILCTVRARRSLAAFTHAHTHTHKYTRRDSARGDDGAHTHGMCVSYVPIYTLFVRDAIMII